MTLDPRLKLIKKKMARIGEVLMFGSGKGGVGKSIVSSAAAYVMAERGLRVAYVDLDFYGSSGSGLFHVEGGMRGSKEGIEPPTSDGVKVVSMGYVLADNPFPLRGGDKPDLLLDLLSSTDFGDLDFMVVDLPPGMGDELTLTRRLAGGKASLIAVTTGSEMSLRVVEKLIKYVRASGTPLLGVVVNMMDLFGGLDLRELGERLGARVLGGIRYYPAIERCRTIREKLEASEGFRRELEEVVDRILEAHRLSP